jgi:hypothetical protein
VQRAASDNQQLVVAGTLPDIPIDPLPQSDLRIPGNTRDTIGDFQPDKAHPDQQLQTERSALEAAARRNIHNPAAMKEFQRDMEFLESRARTQNLSSEEVSNTYHQINRLFSASGTEPLSSSQRSQLAQDAMRQSAHPEKFPHMSESDIRDFVQKHIAAGVELLPEVKKRLRLSVQPEDQKTFQRYLHEQTGS